MSQPWPDLAAWLPKQLGVTLLDDRDGILRRFWYFLLADVARPDSIFHHFMKIPEHDRTLHITLGPAQPEFRSAKTSLFSGADEDIHTHDNTE